MHTEPDELEQLIRDTNNFEEQLLQIWQNRSVLDEHLILLKKMMRMLQPIHQKAYKVYVKNKKMEMDDKRKQIEQIKDECKKNYLQQKQNVATQPQQGQQVSQELMKQIEQSQADLQIKLRESLLELKDGVPVRWVNKTGQEWLDICTKRALLVGIVGDFKTGKSFMVSKLSKKKFYQHSMTKSTIGLNFVFGEPHQDKRVFLVDSAGFGEPMQIFRSYDRPKPQNTESWSNKDYYTLRKQWLDYNLRKPKIIHLLELKQKSVQESIEKNPENEDQILIEFEKWKIDNHCTQTEIDIINQKPKEDQIFFQGLTDALTKEEDYKLQQLNEIQNINEEKARRNIESQILERVTQKFVMEQSSVLIIMVTRLSKQQENLIQQLQRMLSEPKNKHKKVIIVHNFYELYLHNEIQDQIQKDIINCFNVEPITEIFKGHQCRYWTDKSISDHNPIVHLAIGNCLTDDLGAKIEFKKFAVHYINRAIAAQTDFSQRNLFETLEDFFSHHLEDYVRINYSKEQLEQHSKDFLVLKEKLKNNPNYQLSENETQNKLVKQKLEARAKFLLPRSKVEFKATESGAFVLKGKYIPKDQNEYRFLQINNSFGNEQQKVQLMDEFTPSYNVSQHLDKIVVTMDIAGLSQDDVNQIKITHNMDLQKQKHYININGQRSLIWNKIFQNSQQDQKIVFDENFKQRLISFGTIDTKIEIADIDTSIDFSRMKKAYYQERQIPEQLQSSEKGLNNYFTGGLLCVVIPIIQVLQDAEEANQILTAQRLVVSQIQ